METAVPILEIGSVLLAAAMAGWMARRLGLPAVIGYLIVGLAVSPFTPGYVANRHQLELLAAVLATVVLSIGASAVAVRLPVAGWERPIAA